MSNTPPPTPPFLRRIWPTLLPVLAALGLPTAAVAYYLTKYPLLALGTFLLYELGVFIVDFLGKVWGKLEDPLAEYIAAWLKQWAITLFSRYHRQYYQYLYYQHRDFDVRGLSTTGTFALELDQVFVELHIDPSTPQAAVVSPIQVPQQLLEGSHSIWDYLMSAPLRRQHLAVIGPPGSGKTTLLKHIVLSLVPRHRHSRRLQRARLRGRLPVLLLLRDHALAIHENEQYSLINAIQDHLAKWDQALPPKGWFERQLRKGRCLVLLDGLDEVADPEVRQQVVGWVERQMARWHQNRFLVTSRPFGYRNNPLQNVTVLEVRAFTSGQVERFVQQWYLANEIMSKQKDDRGVRMRATSESRALLQRLRTTPALFVLTVNPLLLTMIATVHRYGGELPGKRAALYAEICQVFLGKRQMARGQQMQFTPAQLQSVLEPLAYQMMDKGIRDIACSEAQLIIEESLVWVSSQITPVAFLHLIENASGLLLERENSLYSFAHQTFQEYLAAVHLKGTQQGRLLAAHVEDTWWRETIRLYCAMEDATPILEACLQDVYPRASTIELAMDCDEEAHKVNPAMRARLETLLKGLEDADPERQHVIAEALLTRRLRQLVHLREETSVDTQLITCAEYQLFLDEQRAKGHYLQPDHWTSSHFPTGQGNSPVLGVRSLDATAFCTWLTERERGLWRYRLPVAGELVMEENMLLSRLPVGVGYWLKDRKGFTWAKEAVSVPDRLIQEVAAYYSPYHLVDSRTNARACTLDLDLTFDLASTRSLALVRTLDLDLTFDLASTRDLVLASNLVGDLAISSTLARILARAHTRASTRARDLPLASNRDLILTHSLANAHASASIFANASTSIFGRALDPRSKFTGDPYFDHDLASALDLAGELATTRTLAHDLDLAVAHDLDCAIDLNNALVQLLTGTFTHATSLALVRAFIRDFAIALVLSIQPERASRRWIKHLFRRGSARKREQNELQRLMEPLLNIDIDLTILQKRMQGELPACEGILIVRERNEAK